MPSSLRCPARPHLQLTERRAGNAAYRARDFRKALHHYERAQAVVEFVQVGKHSGKNRIRKAIGLYHRAAQLMPLVFRE